MTRKHATHIASSMGKSVNYNGYRVVEERGVGKNR